MGEHKNLSSAEAIEKIKDIASGAPGMLCTIAADGTIHARPMATQQVADDGTIWMFSAANSEKNVELARDERVQLFYSVPGKSQYLALAGTASISRDRAKIDELWSGWAKAWFTEGKDDPSLTLIAIRPSRGEYWDTKYNRMIQLAMIAIGAITGRTMDGGVTGSLDVAPSGAAPR